MGTGELERAVAAPAAELGRRVLLGGLTGRAGNRLLAVPSGRVLGIVAARRFGAVGLFAALNYGRFYGGGVAGVGVEHGCMGNRDTGAGVPGQRGAG